MPLRRAIGFGLGIAIVLATASGPAMGQYGRRYGYPGGYGRYGWGGWGMGGGGGSYANDPAAGYMTGLGSYARGMGSYEVQDAQARSINAGTILKWNDALRARQRALRQEQQKEDAEKQAQLRARAAADDVESGATLNDLLDRIQEFNPGGIKADAARAEVAPAAIRDIPFQPATEAISICLDQMTADDAWPEPLQDDRFAPDRQAVRSAVRTALDEDVKGEVSDATLKRLDAAVNGLRSKFRGASGDFDLIYADADTFTRGLAGLSRLLKNPAYQKVLAELETYKGTTAGDLLAFMQAFNLRFGPAATDRQSEIYRQLVPMFGRVLAASDGAGRKEPLPADATGQPLRQAAREVFKDMSWQHLDAHAKPEE